MSRHGLSKAALAGVVLLIAVTPQGVLAQSESEFPEVIVTGVRKARDLRLQDKPDEAQAILEPIGEKYPSYFPARYNLGLAYAAQNDTDAALRELNAAKKIKIDYGWKDATIYNSLGWVYLESGDYDAALEEFSLALQPTNFSQLNPTSQRKVLNNTALAYAYLGKPGDAAKYFDLAEKVKLTATQPSSSGSKPQSRSGPVNKAQGPAAPVAPPQ